MSKIVVMGVSGCGKSLIGSQLAKALSFSFFDGDDFHSSANVDKMSQGIPLTDDDRAEWLQALSELLQAEQQTVVACSALKRKYRDQLRALNPELQFVYLQGDEETIWQRLSAREGHYFHGREMLKSQLRALEAPDTAEATIIGIEETPESMVEGIIQAMPQVQQQAAE